MEVNRISLHQRSYGRSDKGIRPLSLSFDQYGYALASVFFQQGNTKVLCSVNIQNNVPPFLRGKKQGWLTAEYSMLPSATSIRTQRESADTKRNGRSVEISRLIGRSLRAVIDLSKIGEQTLVVDCDVLQADGGTRTAAITGAFLALEIAIERLYPNETDRQGIIKERLAAVSLGINKKNAVLLDLDCKEDMAIDADFNFVLTESGKIIEIQGTAETNAIPWELFHKMCVVAQEGVAQIFNEVALARRIDMAVMVNSGNKTYGKATLEVSHQLQDEKTPFFSIKNRQKMAP